MPEPLASELDTGTLGTTGLLVTTAGFDALGFREAASSLRGW